MENFRRGTTTETSDVQNYTPQIHAETDEVQTNYNPIKNTDCLIDTLPGTSKYCNCSSGKLKDLNSIVEADRADVASLNSTESFVCRICHNNENSEKLISPCLCKGSLSYVHSDCLERWISMSRCTTCELCQFQYNTEQTLRYTFYQSLRMWYSRSMSRRALQEDCQIFLLLTLIAFGIVGTLLVAVQYYILQSHVSGLGRVWTTGWLIFFLLTTLLVYLINVYMIARAQLVPWYRWWRTARDIRLIIENHNPEYASLKQFNNEKNLKSSTEAMEETISQTAKVCCSHQTLETVLNNDEIQQNSQHVIQGFDATREDNTKCLTTFCSKNCNKYNNQLEILREKKAKDFRTQMLESIKAAATKISSLLNMALEPKFDGLTLTI